MIRRPLGEGRDEEPEVEGEQVARGGGLVKLPLQGSC